MLNPSLENPVKLNSIMNEEPWTQISQALSDSLRRHVKVTIQLSGPGEAKQIRGFVTVINTYLEEIKLREEDEWLWIKFSDIRSVRT